jgi:hypothetical protein
MIVLYKILNHTNMKCNIGKADKIVRLVIGVSNYYCWCCF